MAGVERVPIDDVRDLIALGEPLPFRVLDSAARLLLNAGQQVASERLLELLNERGAWVDRDAVEERRRLLQPGGGLARPSVVRKRTLFDLWEQAVWDLDALLRRTLAGSAGAGDWPALAASLVTLVDHDVDVALFVAVRQDDRRFALYPLTHALNAAVLALVVARQAGWTPERQLGVVGAALSMNAALLELQAQMAEQDTPPTTRQLDTIRAHPARAAALLQAAGITDEAWLQAVAQHHERADGSGYPQGLSEVTDEARLLRMADVYMAKITARAGRPALPALTASRQLFQQEAGSPLAAALIKAIGVHPPGSLVMLKSGEVAVVKRRGSSGPAPLVCTLSDRQGKPSVNSQELDTTDPAHAITGPCTGVDSYSRVPGERVYGMLLVEQRAGTAAAGTLSQS